VVALCGWHVGGPDAVAAAVELAWCCSRLKWKEKEQLFDKFETVIHLTSRSAIATSCQLKVGRSSSSSCCC
jgi:hypothetical protein